MTKLKRAARRERAHAARIANDPTVRAELGRALRHASAVVRLARRRRRRHGLVEGLRDPKLQKHGVAVVHSLERAAAAARGAPSRRRRTLFLGTLALGLGAAAAVAVAKVTS